MKLIAKPIVKNQLWIVTDGAKKVGKVEFSGSSYRLDIDGVSHDFDSTGAVQRLTSIEFQRPGKISRNTPPYEIWPTTGKAYNSVYDVKKKLHLYTKTKKSKCYHAAGWFKLKLGGQYEVVFCPKYIFIQRYPYSGPYMSRQEAECNK